MDSSPGSWSTWRWYKERGCSEARTKLASVTQKSRTGLLRVSGCELWASCSATFATASCGTTMSSGRLCAGPHEPCFCILP